MAIVWGPRQINPSNGYGYELGIDFTQSPASVTGSTGLVTITAKIYIHTRWSLYYGAGAGAKLWWSGSFGSAGKEVTFNIVGTGNDWDPSHIALLHTLTRQVTASTAQAYVSSLTASTTGFTMIERNASVSSTWTTAKKPTTASTISAPAAPGTIIAKIASTGIAVQWSRMTTASAPWSSVQVQRWNAEQNAWYDYTSGAGDMWGFTDTNVWPGNRYIYRARATNSAGSSAWSQTDAVYTTPGLPVSPKATRSGNNIVLTWSRPVTYPSVSYALYYDIVRQENGGPWLYDQLVSISTATTWTHTAPSVSTTYRYAIRARGLNPSTDDQASAYVHSNSIALSSPPLAPTDLSPNSGTAAGAPVVFSWTHTPQDGSPQSSAEIRWREVGASTWNTATVNGTAETYTIGALAAEKNYEWDVRTKGYYDAFGSWTRATFGVSQAPSVTINTTARTVWGQSNTLELYWTYTDPAGNNGSKYDATITNNKTGQVIRNYEGVTRVISSGVATSFSVQATDKTSYTLRVRAADSWGVWSPWATATVTTNFLKPAVPSLSATFVELTGAAQITVTSPGGTPSAAATEIYKYVGQGNWELAYTGAGASFTWTDWSPNYGAGAYTLYMAKAVSSYPSESLSNVLMIVTNPPGCNQWLWLSSLSHPEARVRLRGNPSVSSTKERAKSLKRFYGNAYPTEFSSPEIMHQLSLSGDLDRSASTWQDWEALVEEPGAMVYRDPWGRNAVVSLGKVSVNSSIRGFEGISADMTVISDTISSNFVTGQLTPITAGTVVDIENEVRTKNFNTTVQGYSSYKFTPSGSGTLTLVAVGNGLFKLVRL